MKELLYKNLKSKSPAKKSIAKSVMKVYELMGAKNATEQRKRDSLKAEKESLLLFLDGKDTCRKLEQVGVSPKLFKTVVLRYYPFGKNEFTLINLIVNYGTWLKTAIPGQVDVNKTVSKLLMESRYKKVTSKAN